MDMKKLAMLAVVLTLTFAVGLVSVNVEDVSAKVFIKNNDRAQQQGAADLAVTQRIRV
jgi:hypothetical protein